MEENDLIKKGFNHGYTLQSKSPKLAVTVANSFKDGRHPYALGFIHGTLEYIKEHNQDVRPYLDLIKKQKSRSQAKDLDRSREWDLEP